MVKQITKHPGEGDLRPVVVVVGAGFGGLRVARQLRGAPVDVLVLDRHNFHTFLPLLYEVATAGLEPDDIAQPVRTILRGYRNVRFRMANVERIDLDGRHVVTDNGQISYDYLIVAAGSATNFFGLGSVEERALGLKDLHQATAFRNHVLRSFERAAIVDDPAERQRLMTTVVIGGGPTGVELAGALAELKRHALPHDYPDLDLAQARVILLEATDRLLAAMPERLQHKAAVQLTKLGVDVRCGATVIDLTDRGVHLKSGETIASANVAWVAGVRGEHVGEAMGVALGAGRRVAVERTLQLAGHPEAYVIGDLAYLLAADGRPYPMVAPVAMQQADVAVKNILGSMRHEAPVTFAYKDRGMMATIGRRMAVARIGRFQFTGFLAWALWLTVHLLQLVGLRSRALVLVNWTWNYFRYDRANRLVTDTNERPREGEHESPNGAVGTDDNAAGA